MPSPPSASTPSGSWGSGSGVRRASRSPCEPQASWRTSGAPCPTSRPRTTWARRTASAATSSTSASAERRDWPLRGARSPSAACDCSSISFPITWRRTIPGSSGIRSTSSAEARRMRGSDGRSFTELAGTVFALGRDPFFPAWPDVLQLNAFHPGLRQAVIETLSEIAEQCDGVRCDMAMLLLNQIFERTWGARAGPWPADELLGAVRSRPSSSGIRGSSSSPRPTGTWSGSCSSRASTTATTRSCTTGWSTATRRAFASTSWPTGPTRRGWSGSSRTTTSRGQPRPSLPGRRVRLRWPCSPSRGPGCSTRGSSREGR